MCLPLARDFERYALPFLGLRSLIIQYGKGIRSENSESPLFD